MRARFSSIAWGLLAAGMALSAQQSEGWQVGAALPVALPALKQWTQQPTGLCLDGGFQMAIPETSSFFRVGMGLNLFPGKEDQGRKTSLTNLQITGDLVIPIGTSPFALLTGASVNAFRQNTSGTWTHDFPDVGTISYEGKGASNVRRSLGKMGLRVGIEYSLSRTMSLTAVLQQTELGTDSEFVKEGLPEYGSSAVNPAWVQIGARLHF